MEGFSEIEQQWFLGGVVVLEVEILVNDEMVIEERLIDGNSDSTEA